MNARQFFDKVVEMRNAQKEYFRTRDNTDKAIEDLEKAIWYINDKIKTMKKNSENICIGYVNIMYDTESSTYVTSGPVYSSREAAYAEGVGKSNYITTVEVKWEAL